MFTDLFSKMVIDYFPNLTTDQRKDLNEVISCLDNIIMEEENNMFDFGNMFNGMFKPVARGYCKMGMDGKVAVKTSAGY